MISRTTKYALNVLRCLAQDPALRVTADKLSRETGVPANYLSKILSQLRKHGIVESEKGWGGGFRLRSQALDRSIRSVTTIFERRPSRVRALADECIFGLKACDNTNPCVLHTEWTRLRLARDEMLETHTVRDLRHKPGARRRARVR